MWKLIILVCWLSIPASKSQLNYEGSPLTENTEYKAEESHYSVRQQSAKRLDDSRLDTYILAANSLGNIDNAPQKVDMIDTRSMVEPGTNKFYKISTTTPLSASSIVISTNRTAGSARQLSSAPSADSLDTFLNSKTPEESQLALDNYLKSRQQDYSTLDNVQIEPGTINQNGEINQQYVAGHHQNPMQGVINQPSELSVSSVIPQQQTGQFINPQQVVYQPWNYQSRNVPYRGPMVNRPPMPYRHSPRFRSRYRAQSRLGPGPKPPIFPEKPIDVIYTRPPGFGHHPPPISNPPVAYEDASAYFPEADHHPGNSKDVYYSQLWQQSYDPHYYNYIAKTGKIKPWLYGKLGKHEEKGFWSELFLSFKKHGMKNMMNPMFLLGLSIPTITLMLSAFVSKRSFARSSEAGYQLSDETLEELAEKVRWAIECYENKRQDCW